MRSFCMEDSLHGGVIVVVTECLGVDGVDGMDGGRRASIVDYNGAICYRGRQDKSMGAAWHVARRCITTNHKP